MLALILGCVQTQPIIKPAATTQTTQATVTSSTTTIQDDGVAYIIPLTTEEPSTTTLASTQSSISTSTTNPLIRTFKDNGGPVCVVDGKPVVRMFGKRECEHCEWVGPVFDRVAKEYEAEGRIIAYHWLFDMKDDALTDVVEEAVPEGEWAVFLGANQTTVPYFSFGCRYTRAGNGYFVQNRPDSEEAEFRAVIEQLLSYSNL